MTLVYLPVVSGSFSEQDVSDFLAAMERLPRPTHAYCRTGTRSITLWALYQRRLGVPAAELLATTEQCGYDLSSALADPAPDRRGTPERGAAQYDIVIVGAGAAGIAAASSLLSRVRDLSIAIIDPAEVHYYQPGWTLVGAGVFNQADTVKTMRLPDPRGGRVDQGRGGHF